MENNERDLEQAIISYQQLLNGNSLLPRWLAKYEQQSHELSLIGLILCADKNDELVELLELDFADIDVAQSS